jgi:hypothetical protein
MLFDIVFSESLTIANHTSNRYIYPACCTGGCRLSLIQIPKFSERPGTVPPEV